MKKQQRKETLPLADQIALRAYALWEADGCPEGADLQHWLRAEAEVQLGKVDPEPDAAPEPQ